MEVKCSCITVTYNYKLRSGKNKGSIKPKTIVYRNESFEIKHSDIISWKVCGLPCEIEVMIDFYDYDESHAAIKWNCTSGHESDGPFQYGGYADNAGDFEQLSKWINYNLINMREVTK